MSRWLFSCLTVLALAGCAGYRLGPTNQLAAGSKTILVRPVQNHTMEPRLSDPVGTALRRQLQQDGTFRLETAGTTDLVVEATILKYERSELTYLRSDVITVQDYQIKLTAHVTVRERPSGKAVLDREVVGKATLRAGSDLPSAERQAVPQVADDLAKNITSLLVDGSW